MYYMVVPCCPKVSCSSWVNCVQYFHSRHIFVDFADPVDLGCCWPVCDPCTCVWHGHGYYTLYNNYHRGTPSSSVNTHQTVHWIVCLLVPRFLDVKSCLGPTYGSVDGPGWDGALEVDFLVFLPLPDVVLTGCFS